MQHAHPLKPPSCERKNTQIPQPVWGTVLGEAWISSCCTLPAAVVGLCKGRHYIAQHKAAEQKGLGHIAIRSFSPIACPFARVKCVESKATDFLQVSHASTVFCWRNCLWGRRHSWGTGGVWAPLQGKRDILSWAACGTIPSPSGTLQPYLDPHNSIWGQLWLASLAQYCQPNLNHQVFNSECPHWALSHWKTQRQMWWRCLHYLPMVQQWVIALGPQGAHKHSWVLSAPRKTLTCTLPPS